MSTTRLTAACKRPFSNGTEGDTWMRNWCKRCAHDHDMHDPDGVGGCTVIALAMCDFPDGWPEAWLPEPDDGTFALPSRLTCLMFTPCEPCGGDPLAEVRAAQTAEVTAYWQRHGQEVGA